MHMQVDQIANTFDTAIRGYVAGPDSPNRMPSINDAVNFVQNTVCMCAIPCVYITSNFELHSWNIFCYCSLVPRPVRG